MQTEAELLSTLRKMVAERKEKECADSGSSCSSIGKGNTASNVDSKARSCLQEMVERCRSAALDCSVRVLAQELEAPQRIASSFSGVFSASLLTDMIKKDSMLTVKIWVSTFHRYEQQSVYCKLFNFEHLIDNLILKIFFFISTESVSLSCACGKPSTAHI